MGIKVAFGSHFSPALMWLNIPHQHNICFAIYYQVTVLLFLYELYIQSCIF